MADNLTKKKADGKRIAFTQKYERNYLKKIAKEQLAILEFGEVWFLVVNRAKMIRICKALIKILK